MAADQRRKRLNGANIMGYGYREQHRTKRQNLGPVQNDLSMKSHVAVEWDANQKTVVAKREQIGISWRHMKPFASSASKDHNVLADVFTIPEEIFDLDNLSEVLSYEVWKTHLSENERNLLMHFLPSAFEPHQTVEELLSGNNFHCGNPFSKWGASLCLGDLHPDVIVDREQHLKSEKRAYYSQLHNYHKDMIGFLTKLKNRWQSCKYPEKETAHKMWRSKNDVDNRMPSSVNGSRVYDHDGNVTLTSESCSWDAEDRVCNTDNQISSLRKDDKLQRRVLEKGIVKGKSRNLIGSPDDMANVGERPNKGDKLPKRNIHSSDCDKYMSCIKISKQQHELVKSMKQSGKNIQSWSLNRVLGNIDNIHVQPYEVFVKDEQKKLCEHWLQLVNKDLPTAYSNWTEKQIQRHAVRNSLVAEMKNKSKPLLEEENNVISGCELQYQVEGNVSLRSENQDEYTMCSSGELQDQDEDNVNSGSKLQDQDEDNMSSGDELRDQDEDNMSSGNELQDQDEDNMSSGNELQDHVEDTGVNNQSNSNDDEDSIVRSPKNQSPHNSYLTDEFFNPVSMGPNKNIISSKRADASPSEVEYSRIINTEDVSINERSIPNSYLRDENPVSMGSEKNIALSKQAVASLNVEYSRNMNTQDVSINEGPTHNPYLRDESLNSVSMGSEKNIVSSRNINTQHVSINEGTPFASGSDVWQAVEMPHPYYDSAVTHDYTSSGLSLANPQVNGEQQTRLTDLQPDLDHLDTDKELLHRQFGDGTFSSYQNQDRSNILQSLFKGEGEGMLSYHPEQKSDEVDFKPSNNVMIGDGQFSSHFKEPLQTSLTLDQGHKRASEVYLPANMPDNIYSDRGRYLISTADPLVFTRHPLPAASMTDWSANTARIAAPPQSHLNSGNFIDHHWFPADHHVRAGWNGSNDGSASSQSLGTRPNTDHSLFSILSQSGHLGSGNPYDSVRNTDQFLAPRTYGELDATIPRPTAVVPQASHAPGYFSGHEAPSGMVPDDMARMSLPHQNSALHDQIGKSYLRSWNQQ
ncbi:putative nuclear factor related to kappa-B-binding protein [Lupinus albus]|uniref:Putative nuclear factor related to kappa-B-binding protein n=1 Tax=Lupinus albus TaxID=3870 RepID=A0A6A4R351_LUPAL|nr:putative nuclear factor related to kappa-B-binding protein [Lupinus albus]